MKFKYEARDILSKKYETRDIWEAKEMKRMGGKSLPLEWGCGKSTTRKVYYTFTLCHVIDLLALEFPRVTRKSI